MALSASTGARRWRPQSSRATWQLWWARHSVVHRAAVTVRRGRGHEGLEWVGGAEEREEVLSRVSEVEHQWYGSIDLKAPSGMSGTLSRTHAVSAIHGRNCEHALCLARTCVAWSAETRDARRAAPPASGQAQPEGR